ncbi:bZIP transcription factor 50 [Lycium barbarum]|uniref:bZIP transcription factor 50 n=1 Tax=Lycium barbarum TaxID=112863 RepID=UPI00293F2317|nr:bZIP transcription factor 50 [Lycium barbarum]
MVDNIDDVVAQINWDDVDHIFPPHEPTMEDIEQLLMNDDDVSADPQFAADFLSDLLVDHSPVVSSGSEDDKDKHKVSQPPSEGEEASDELNNDVPLDKKRKRQLRNRDAAVRSRERKKLYVRDLELKSRYFESECKRLGFVLQCCLAENQALRFSLQNSSANGVSMTKQESAVLLLESLLLGSLLWFLGITCLLILPSQTWSSPEENLGSRNHGLLVPIKEGNKTSQILVFVSMMGKRCKASRSRMKFNPHSLGIVV